MQLSAVLDTVIGVAFTFFLLSTACSAVAEGVATILKKRAKYLLRGLREMLDAPEQPAAAVPQPGAVGQAPVQAPVQVARPATAPTPTPVIRAGRAVTSYAATTVLRGRGHTLVRQADDERNLQAQAVHLATNGVGEAADAFSKVLAHPLLAGQVQRRATGEVTRLPSYLSAHSVAAAIIDALVPNAAGATTLTELQDAINGAGLSDRLAKSLLAIANRTEADATTFVSGIERWYDDQMARISGHYKRWIKRWILVIAALFVLLLHIDAVALTSTLWNDPSARAAAVAVATPAVSATVCDSTKPGTTATVAGKAHTNDTQDYLQCLSGEGQQLTKGGVPIGPPTGCSLTRPQRCLFPTLPRHAAYSFGAGAAVILGLLLSVLAASFGSPFWFGILTRATSLRNAGDKPTPAGGAAS